MVPVKDGASLVNDNRVRGIVAVVLDAGFKGLIFWLGQIRHHLIVARRHFSSK
jgi:hypothetical protein